MVKLSGISIAITEMLNVVKDKTIFPPVALTQDH